MSYRSWKWLGLCAVAAVMLGVAITVVVGSISKTDESRSRVEAEPITSAHRIKGDPHRLWIEVSTRGFCKGKEDRPVLEPVRVAEAGNGTATVTGNVRYSAAHAGMCLGVGYGIAEKVRFSRPVARLMLYDGSVSPPRKFWPR
jgi:hypothetical protein